MHLQNMLVMSPLVICFSQDNSDHFYLVVYLKSDISGDDIIL
ncbi:hypothetical protein F544_19720 [Bibersteinia trehalosi USDA-ARS-USMARC-190]|uniref:Uncharacterized protein n=1 Tax=Bibersteinia trehalosi USDA-ARS-USMARC-190 TaxID=1263832 RepID=W0RA71_BIBTR|nr:hypothetical protein F544_19720 [Bibersteinia trehalosi USDA-ARS-USMARC-190]